MSEKTRAYGVVMTDKQLRDSCFMHQYIESMASLFYQCGKDIALFKRHKKTPDFVIHVDDSGNEQDFLTGEKHRKLFIRVTPVEIDHYRYDNHESEPCEWEKKNFCPGTSAAWWEVINEDGTRENPNFCPSCGRKIEQEDE